MQNLINPIKDNPFKSAISIVSIIGILTFAMRVNAFIVTQSEFKDYKNQVTISQQQIEKQIKSLKDDTTENFKRARIENLQDKIFELRIKKESGEATATEKAMLEKFKSDLDNLHN